MCVMLFYCCFSCCTEFSHRSKYSVDILNSSILALVLLFSSQAVQESCDGCYNVSESHPQHEYAVSESFLMVPSCIHSNHSYNYNRSCDVTCCLVSFLPVFRYPDATPEDLQASDNVCIICREEMVTGAKKLPCNHIFHSR